MQNEFDKATVSAGENAACGISPALTGVPRIVTTGRKNTEKESIASGESNSSYDVDTGEPISFFSTGRHIKFTRHLVPDNSKSSSIALIDALAFSLVPPEDCDQLWVLAQMEQFLPIEDIQGRNGCFGFKYSARFGDGAGLIAWGGQSQRGRIYFSIQGKGCSMVRDWDGLAAWLKTYRATLRRVDVAHDDFDAETISIDWAVEQYKAGGFNSGGRKPAHNIIGDWLQEDGSAKGRTVGIGNRQSGKYCRIYEKGKEQGDSSSTWVRVEVEWRAQDRNIPIDILLSPGRYLAGAYPCLDYLSQEQSRIKTIAKGGQITFDKAVENARQLSGKVINLMLLVHGGDALAVAEALRRDGVPSRVEPYSYHIVTNPELIDLDPVERQQD